MVVRRRRSVLRTLPTVRRGAGRVTVPSALASWSAADRFGVRRPPARGHPPAGASPARAAVAVERSTWLGAAALSSSHRATTTGRRTPRPYGSSRSPLSG